MLLITVIITTHTQVTQQVRYLHVSGGEVNISLELLAERSDDGQADALVAACYYGDLGGHVCLEMDIN